MVDLVSGPTTHPIWTGAGNPTNPVDQIDVQTNVGTPEAFTPYCANKGRQ